MNSTPLLSTLRWRLKQQTAGAAGPATFSSRSFSHACFSLYVNWAQHLKAMPRGAYHLQRPSKRRHRALCKMLINTKQMQSFPQNIRRDSVLTPAGDVIAICPFSFITFGNEFSNICLQKLLGFVQYLFCVCVIKSSNITGL